MTDTLPELWVDSQEKSGIIDRIDELDEYFPRIQVKDLTVYDEDKDEWIKCGDYTNEYHSFILEHKIIWDKKKNKEGDFHTSLTSGRSQDQVAKIHLYYEGNKSFYTEGYLVQYARLHPKLRARAYAFVGELANMGISFNECYDMDDFLEKLYWINKKSGSAPMGRTDIKNEGRFVISQLVSLSKVPHVGMGRAKALFKEFGNIHTILYYEEELAERVDGIGPICQQAIIDWAHDLVIINDEEVK